MEIRGSLVAFILPCNIQFCLFPGLLYWHITVLCYLFGLYPILKEIAGIKEHALPHEINYPCSVGFLEILISCILTYASVSDFYYCLPFIYILFLSSTEGEYFFRLSVGCNSSSQDLNRLAFFFSSVLPALNSHKITESQAHTLSNRDTLTVWWPSFCHLPHFLCSTYSCETFPPLFQQQSPKNAPQFDACLNLQNILRQKWHW